MKKDANKGKRFARRATWTAETVEDIDAIAAESEAATLEAYIADWSAWAAGTLRSSGLPDAPLIWWLPDGRWWPHDQKPNFRANCSAVTDYVKAQGYTHDCMEGIAAEILFTLYRADQADNPYRSKLIFDLGWLCKTAVDRGVDRDSQSGKAQKPRNREPDLGIRGLRCFLETESQYVDAQTIIDWLDGYPRTYDDDDIELSLSGNDVTVRDLASNKVKTIPRRQLSTYLRRARNS